MNSIGIKIRKLRIQKDLSQDNLAFELGITQASYSRIEKDDRRISIIRLIQIAAILKTSVVELISEKAKKINIEKFNYSISDIDNISQIDSEHIQSLKDEIAFLRKLLEQCKSFSNKKSYIK